jgi:hypothetical protein
MTTGFALKASDYLLPYPVRTTVLVSQVGLDLHLLLTAFSFAHSLNLAIFVCDYQLSGIVRQRLTLCVMFWHTQ